jgi:hypothetical protein
MPVQIPRRKFLKAAPIAAYALTQAARGASLARPPAAPLIKIAPFDYKNVLLLDSRWQRQYQAARDFYFGVSDDDILHGFRVAAGLLAAGAPRTATPSSANG